MDGYKIRIDKFCIDTPAEKKKYEDLINNPEVMIIDDKTFNSQGKHINTYQIVRWCEPEPL